MKNKCLQFIFGLSLFFCLAFLSVPNVKAVNSVFIQNLYSAGYYPNANTSGQTFSGTSTSYILNKIEISIGSAGGGDNRPSSYIVCEISSTSTPLSNANCGSAANHSHYNRQTTNTCYYPNCGSSLEPYLATGTPMTINPGKKYEFVTAQNNNVYYDWDTANHYTGGGYFNGNSGAGYGTTDYYFKLSGTLAVWCGDGTCNNGETNGTCAADCEPSGSIVWAGVGSQPGVKGMNYEIPFLYNFCDDYNAINAADVCLTSNDSGINSENCVPVLQPKDQFIGPQQCSGLAYYTAYIPESATTTSATLNLELFDPTGTILNTINSTSFNISLNDISSTGNYIISGLTSFTRIIDLQNNPATTTPLLFSYNMVGLAATSTNICVYNTSGVSTGNCFEITSNDEFEFGIINLPIPTTNFDFTGYFGSDTFLYLKSQNFTISFTNENPAIAHNIENLLGTTTADIVCSADEWATPDPVLDFGFATTSLAAFNFTKIKCNLFKGVLDVSNKITNGLETAANVALEKMLKIFPFVIPANIKKSWDDAATTTLPTELAFLEIGDDNGNIDLSIPPLYSSGTSTVWHVWGPNLWGNTGAINTMLANWRILTKYLLYAAWFLLVIYGLAELVLHKTEK